MKAYHTLWFLWDVFFLAFDLAWFVRNVLAGDATSIIIFGACAITMAWFAEREWRAMRRLSE